jgi:hypothetical protein
VVFAIDHLFLGSTDPDGKVNLQNGWKNYGIDLDHRNSTADSTDLCKPLNNAAPKQVYPDGTDGVDNSWGKNILPMLFGLSSSIEEDLNSGFSSGKGTMLFSLGKLGSQQDYNPLDTCVYDGADLMESPKFDGSDSWPVRAGSLSNPADLASCKGHFPSSYVSGDVWVSGPTSVSLTIPLGSGAGFNVPFVLHNPVIYARISPDRSRLTEGIIAGVLDTEEYKASWQKAAGSLDPSLCQGPTIESILAQIAQASDILADGTQDPSKSCSGISVGLGFTARAVQLGSITPDEPPPPDPCQPN